MNSPIVAMYKDKDSNYIACRHANEFFSTYKLVPPQECNGFIYHEKDLDKPIELIAPPLEGINYDVPFEEYVKLEKAPNTQLLRIK